MPFKKCPGCSSGWDVPSRAWKAARGQKVELRPRWLEFTGRVPEIGAVGKDHYQSKPQHKFVRKLSQAKERTVWIKGNGAQSPSRV